MKMDKFDARAGGVLWLVIIVGCLWILWGCAHVREHKAAYVAWGIVATVVLVNQGDGTVSTSPCDNIPPYKYRMIYVCNRHFPR